MMLPIAMPAAMPIMRPMPNPLPPPCVAAPNVLNPISVRIPAGTQSGQVFHLRGRGLPRVNASGTGDLHVRVQLWTPQSLSEDQEELVKQLAATDGEPPATRSKGIWSRMKEALGA